METWRHFLIVGLAVTALTGNAIATNGTELLYVANSQGDDLTIVRLPDHQPLGSVRVRAHPHGLAASRDGRWLYVSVESSKEILVLDTATDQIIWRVRVSGLPNQIALSGDGHHLFVPIRLADYVEVIDTQQRRSIGKIKVGRSPHNTLASADGRHIYATSMDDHRVTIIDAASLAVLGTIPCGGIVRPIDVTRDETRMYAALSDLHGFVVADIPSRKIVERVPLPPVPEGVEPLVPHTPTHGLGADPGRSASGRHQRRGQLRGAVRRPRQPAPGHRGNRQGSQLGGVPTRRSGLLREQRRVGRRIGGRPVCPQGGDPHPGGEDAEAAGDDRGPGAAIVSPARQEVIQHPFPA